MTRALNIIITSLDHGGTETHLLQVLPGLKKRGWCPKIYTLRSDCALKTAFEKQAIPVHSPKKICMPFAPLRRFLESLIAVRGIRKALKKDPGCIAHFFLAQAYIFGMVAAKMAGHKGPKIMSRRSLNIYQKKLPFIGWLEQKLHHQADFFLGNSQAVKADLLNEGVPAGKTQVLYNGIDLTRFDIKPKPLENIESPFIITIVANLIPYKGHRDLLMALSKIKGQLPNGWLLLCVGRDRGIQSDLQQQANTLELKNHVKFLGVRNDVPNVLLNSELGVLCSHEEGMPNAVMEYMAARLPVVATRAGGTVELVDDGETGFLVPIKDPTALATAILKIATDKASYKMGQKGRKKIEKEFSLDQCVQAYDAIYKKLLEE